MNKKSFSYQCQKQSNSIRCRQSIRVDWGASNRLETYGLNQLAVKPPSAFCCTNSITRSSTFWFSAILTLLMGHFSDAVIGHRRAGQYVPRSECFDALERMLSAEATVYRNGFVKIFQLPKSFQGMSYSRSWWQCARRSANHRSRHAQESALTGEADSVEK